MRSKIGSVCMALGTVLLAAAIVLLAYNAWDNWRAGQTVAEVDEALREIVQSDTGGISYLAANAESSGSISDDTEEITAVRITDGASDAENETADTLIPTVQIDGYDYIGTLSIPSLGLELPIMYEWSYPGLKIAPGRYSGSASTDDLIICGHNYERHFGGLKNLNEGAKIIFTDVTGMAYSYEVAEVVTLRPTAIHEMLSQESGEWDLTLFTCTLGGRTRVTVRCRKTEDDEGQAG